jgi:hypothetical protein
MIAKQIAERKQRDAEFEVYAAENPSPFSQSQVEWRRSSKSTEIELRSYQYLRFQLAKPPIARLRDSLRYWFQSEVESEADPNDEYYPEYDLRPVLTEAMERLDAGNLEGALLVLRDALIKIGAVMPEDLDVVYGQTWADVEIENIGPGQ